MIIFLPTQELGVEVKVYPVEQLEQTELEVQVKHWGIAVLHSI